MSKVFVATNNLVNYLPLATESLNAVEVSGGRFELRNSSLLRLDTAYGDIVSAIQDENGNFWLRRVVKKSCYSSIRIACRNGNMNLFSDFLADIGNSGAGVSGLLEYRVALITIPPDMMFSEVYKQALMLGGGYVVCKMSDRHSHRKGDLSNSV